MTFNTGIFRKSVQETQVPSKQYKNNGYFTWKPIYLFLSYLARFFLEWEILRTNFFLEKIKTSFSVQLLFFFANRAVYMKLCNNTAEPGRPPKTIWSVPIACWVPKATAAPSEYVILIAFVRQQWLQQCASVLRYTYTVCLVNLPTFWDALLHNNPSIIPSPPARLLVSSPMV
jgi:hypothetical protein